ncbi:MAG: hypothetical protein EXS52_01840 [Candidatus Staskawiczbacteria bacterium]|nr:hypothetical protein [Candidatus Staskawiczbacteria bacterium]
MNTTHKILLLGCFVFMIALSFVIGVSDASASMVCSGGSCFYAMCSSDYDCGGAGFIGIQTCTNNSVYQNYKTNICMNPGTQQSYCISSSAPQLQKVCSSSETCSYGSCVGDSPKNVQTTLPVYYNPTPTPSTQPATFIRHYRTNCYAGNVYWFNSQGGTEDPSKVCVDASSCTVDSCSSSACKNTLRCDGSTCATNSADYLKYCVGSTTQTTTAVVPQVTIQIPQAQVQNISIALTGKKESESKYAKEFSITNSDVINLLVVVRNISNTAIENVVIKVDGDPAIAYDQNIKVDNVPSVGNMVTGINLGTLPAGISKEVLFSGAIKPETLVGSVKITSTVSYQNITNTDSVTVSLLGEVKNNFAASLGSSAFMSFFKKWWLWILATLILVVLLFVIYRRISSDV